jgi:ubiquinone/menaquinone biosynthesis C-methylase UbiE
MKNKDIIEFNRKRWNELSKAGIVFSLPWEELTAEEARTRIDPHSLLGDVTGKQVMCLAASGGQQSVAFCILGGIITVYDLSEIQLQKDIETTKSLGYTITAIQGDMQDLSCLDENSFDIIWLAHGINFVPSSKSVIEEVVRVLKPGGLFRMECTNPFVHGLWERWTGSGFELNLPYIDGGEVKPIDEYWGVEQPNGEIKQVKGPKEFRHSLSTLVNTLIDQNMMILGLWESDGGDISAEPGSWKHFKSLAPPWIEIWGKNPGSRDQITMV